MIARTCELPAGAGVELSPRAGPAPARCCSPIRGSCSPGRSLLRRHRRGVVQATGAIVLNRVDVVAVHYCHQVGPSQPEPRQRRSTGSIRALVGHAHARAERLCFRVNRPAVLRGRLEGVAEEVREHYPEPGRQRASRSTTGSTPTRSPRAPARTTPRELREELGIGADRLVAVFVGRRVGAQGARAADPRARARAGVGSGRGRQTASGVAIEQLADVAGRRRDTCTGSASPRDVAARVRSSATRSCCQRRYETFSLVTFEAASQRPAAAGDAGERRARADPRRARTGF